MINYNHNSKFSLADYGDDRVSYIHQPSIIFLAIAFASSIVLAGQCLRLIFKNPTLHHIQLTNNLSSDPHATHVQVLASLSGIHTSHTRLMPVYSMFEDP